LLANIIVKPGRIELQEINIPKPSVGEILVKIKAALTCGTDLKAFLRGHPMIPMPGIFGHEFSGIIADIGRGVKGFKKGDEIMAVHTAPCLRCKYCRKKLYNLCENIMDTKILGAFAEYILLPSHIVKQNTFHKPKNLTFEEAAFLEPLSCVVHSVEPLGIKSGDSALIIGAGPIGLLHLLLLKKKGAKVVVADINNERLKIAKKLGADFVFRTNASICPVIPPHPPLAKGGEEGPLAKGGEALKKSGRVGLFLSATPLCKLNPPTPPFSKPNPPSPPFGKGGQGGILMRDIGRLLEKERGEDYQLNKFTDGIGFDFVFECTGKPEVWEASVNYVRRGGTVILFGGCESGTTVTYDTGRIHYDEITLKGVFHYTPSDVEKAYKLLCEGKLGVKRLISGRHPLTHTQQVFDKLSKGIGIKYAIIPSRSL
jgi:threonine dehydrogenase-like Zn-dependent dehydrogenase